jgi:hypothetical protein
MPTLTYVEGFEHQNLSALAFGGGAGTGICDGITGSPTIDTTNPRTGAACLQITASANLQKVLKQPFGGFPSVSVVSLYIRFPTLPSADCNIFNLGVVAGAANSGRLWFNQATGKLHIAISLTKNGTDVGPVLSSATWYRVDMRLNVSSNPALLDCRVDGGTNVQVSVAQAATNVDGWVFGNDNSTATYTCQYDDFVASSTSADYPIGPHKVLMLQPGSGPTGQGNPGTNVMEDGTGTDITDANPAWSKLDEAPALDSAGADTVAQAAVGASNYAEVNFQDTAEGTIWAAVAFASLRAGGLTANDGTTRIVYSDATTVDIYSGDMSETTPNHRVLLLTTSKIDSTAELNGLVGRVGFSSNVASVPWWLALSVQYAVPEVISPDANVTPPTVSATTNVPVPSVVADTTVLVPVVAAQFVDGTDLTSYTTGSLTPTSGALYLAFVVGRTSDVAYRAPTLIGTNGWNVTWTRVPAATAIYRFAGIDRGGTDVFWGVASSAVAGTLTFDYGAGSNLKAGTLHLIRIDGGPNTTAPIGATATNHIDVNTGNTISAILSATPATTSLIVACSFSDLNTGTMTPGSGYTALGSVQVGGSAGVSQPLYDEAPTSSTVGATWSANDILALSAVEIRKAGVPTGPFPVVAATNFAVKLVADTVHNVVLPAGISAGNRLMMFAVWDGSATLSGMPVGWTQVLDVHPGLLSVAVWEKISASGSETDFTFTTSVAEQSAIRTWRIAGSHATQPAEAGAAVNGTGTSLNPNDPVPSWGAADTLWVVFAGIDGSLTVSSYPTNYTDNRFSGDTGNTTQGAGVVLCSRNLNALQDDAGAVVISASSTYIVHQIAIRPAAAAGGPPVPKIQRVRIVKSAAVQNRASRW